MAVSVSQLRRIGVGHVEERVKLWINGNPLGQDRQLFEGPEREDGTDLGWARERVVEVVIQTLRPLPEERYGEGLVLDTSRRDREFLGEPLNEEPGAIQRRELVDDLPKSLGGVGLGHGPIPRRETN